MLGDAAKTGGMHDICAVLTQCGSGHDDCGESGAGRRLLTLLEQTKRDGVAVAVTRYCSATALIIN